MEMKDSYLGSGNLAILLELWWKGNAIFLKGLIQLTLDNFRCFACLEPKIVNTITIKVLEIRTRKSQWYKFLKVLTKSLSAYFQCDPGFYPGRG